MAKSETNMPKMADTWSQVLNSVSLQSCCQNTNADDATQETPNVFERLCSKINEVEAEITHNSFEHPSPNEAVTPDERKSLISKVVAKEPEIVKRLEAKVRSEVRTSSACQACIEGIKAYIKRKVLNEHEGQLLGVGRKLWDAVKVNKQDMHGLDKAESLLLMKVISGESKGAFGQYKEELDAFHTELKKGTAADSLGGSEITFTEFNEAYLKALSEHAGNMGDIMANSITSGYDKLKKELALPADRTS